MAQLLIAQKPIQEPGKYWEICMDREEMEILTCKYCGRGVKPGDIVFICSRCKKTVHKSCAPLNNMIWNDLCKHPTEFDYKCGTVKLNG